MMKQSFPAIPDEDAPVQPQMRIMLQKGPQNSTSSPKTQRTVKLAKMQLIFLPDKFDSRVGVKHTIQGVIQILME